MYRRYLVSFLLSLFQAFSQWRKDLRRSGPYIRTHEETKVNRLSKAILLILLFPQSLFTASRFKYNFKGLHFLQGSTVPQLELS